MMIVDGKLKLTESELALFQELTRDRWVPRTTKEFDLMCELAMERHRTDDSLMGEIWAQAIRAAKFGPNGEHNFPIDRRKMEEAMEQAREIERETDERYRLAGFVPNHSS
jgi:hypothetical protein